MDDKKSSSSNPGGLLVGGGTLLGMGVGFITGNLPAGLFIGLGLGMIAFAVSSFLIKQK
jgi:hypothetical protein